MQFNNWTLHDPVKIKVADAQCLSLQADVNLAQGTAETVAVTGTHTGAVVIRTGAILMIGENTLQGSKLRAIGRHGRLKIVRDE